MRRLLVFTALIAFKITLPSQAAKPASSSGAEGQMPEVIIKGGDKSGVKSERPPLDIQIDPDENSILIRALAGRFHYPRDLASGRIQGTVEAAKRASGLYSHPVMALAYGLAVLFPPEDWARPPAVPKGPPPGPRAKSWLGT